jgi:hypothetical protein
MALFDDIPMSGGGSASDRGLFGDIPKAASGGLFTDIPLVERTFGGQVKEAGKGILPGLIKFGGSTLRGTAANLKQGQYNAARFGREQIAVMDRIDRGETVPETEDAIGYQHMTLEERRQVRAEMAEAQESFAPGRVEDSALFKAGDAVADFGDRLAPAAPGYEDSLGRQIGEGIGSVAGAAAASIVGGPTIAAATFAMAGAGEAVDRAIQEGASEEDILKAAKAGLIPGMTDSVPIETLLGRVPVPGGGFIKVPVGMIGDALRAGGRIGFQALIEGIQEGGQEFLQNAIEKYVYNPDQELIEGVPESAGIGATIGGLVETAATPFRQRGAQPARPQARPAAGAFDDLLPAGATPAEQVLGDEPVDPGRLNSPRLTPEDRASPIPNSLIDDGKKIIEEATAGEIAAPTPAKPSAVSPPTSVDQAASAIERAILRRAGSSDDEIDVMSREERHADIRQALDSGIKPTEQDLAAARIYGRATAAPAPQPAPPASAETPAAVSVPETPVARSEPPVAVSPATEEMRRSPASWVIRNKETGEVIMETFDRKKVEALNTAKYEAVPIIDHLAGLSRPGQVETTRPVTPETPKIDKKYSDPIPARLPIARRDMERDTAVTSSGRAAAFSIRAADARPAPDTPEFKNWFKESRVVDDSGAPMVVYHGGPAKKIDQFRPEFIGKSNDTGFYGRGFYFSPSRELAEEYRPVRGEKRSGAVQEVYLKVQKPFIYDVTSPELEADTIARVKAVMPDAEVGLTGIGRVGDRRPAAKEQAAADFTAALKAAGYDGVFVEAKGLYPNGSPHEIVVFDPAQVKSVNNRGTFDPADPRVRYAKRSEEPAPQRVLKEKIAAKRATSPEREDRDDQHSAEMESPAGPEGRPALRSRTDQSEAGPRATGKPDSKENIGQRSGSSSEGGAFNIRETAGQGIAVEFVLTDAFVRQAGELTSRLRAELDRVGLKDIGLRVSERISAIVNGQEFPVNGQYFRQMIDVALDSRDPLATLHHESLHAMKRLGLFSTNEWEILARKSEKEWIGQYNIGSLYGMFPKRVQVEEGIAHAYADWAAGGKVDGIIARSFRRMRAFVEALRNALDGLGFRSAESIFRSAARGEVGARPRRQIRDSSEPAFSMSERRDVVGAQGIPTVRAVSGALGARIMRSIKQRKDDGETLGEYSHRKLIDYLDPVRRMIEAEGGTVQDTMNAYLQARLAEDSSLARIQSLHDSYVTPMVEALSKSGALLEDLHRYLYALHAEERNRVVGLRNPEESDLHRAATDPAVKGASGWSTNEARRVLRDFAADGAKLRGLKEAAGHIRALLDRNLLDQKKAGLISDETYALLKDQWKHYVPLRADDGMDENGDYLPGRGRGFDVRGDEFKAATGRSTEAENIPTWAVSIAERTQLRAEKNAVGKAMLRFINAHDPTGERLAKVYWTDDAGFGDIEKAPAVYRREIGKDGKVTSRKVPPSTIAPDMFAVKVGGKAYYIKFADPKVGLALKKMGQIELDALSRLARKWTGWQSLINTRGNPAFVPINIIRDAATGGVHLLDEGFSAAESAKIVASIPQAWGALWRNARGRPGKGPWDAALREYITAGGKITFEPHKSLDEAIDDLRRRMTEAVDGKSAPKAVWQAFTKFVGDLNDAGENGMRLSAYVAAREKGRTVKQAAFLGRDLTVDFKKHGEVGPLLNSWYVFFNASIQGNYNIARRLAKSKTVRRAAFAIAASGVLVDLLNRALSGDDEDGESYYSKMLRNEPWKLERQMVIFYGSGEGDYFSVPLPYGYNALYHLGVQASAAAHGDIEPLEAVAQTIRVAFDAFNPIGSGGSWWNLILPTVLDPGIEIATNTNFFGSPISPPKYESDNTPDSYRHWHATPDVFRWIADQTNKASGGNEIEPGAIDVSPDTYEHLWGYVSGGIGRFFGQVFDTGGKLATGRADEIEPENVPWVRSFYGRMGEDSQRAEYYRQREEVDSAKATLKDYLEAGRSEDARDFIERNRVAVSSIPAFDAAEKRLRKIRKAKRAIDLDREMPRAEKDERLKPLIEAELRLMNQARVAHARNRLKETQR